MHVDQTTLERLAARLPGYDVAELRVLETDAQILPDELLDEEAGEIAARVAEEHKVAGPPMMGRDGRPTVLKIVMWMCHADSVNLNGDSFVGEELKAQAPALFREPNFGVMDWNHAAVFSWNDDPKLMGVWYKADWAFDKQAADGKGAWGLLVTGMMFAWLFPEQTDALVAEQVRSGSIKGSMACIPKSVEFGDVGGQRAAILHNPVFFTHSLLDVPPADPSALGRASEDPDTTVDTLRVELMGVEDVQTQLAALKAELHEALARVAAKEEVMTPEQIAALEQAKATLETQVAELAAKVAELEAELAKKAPPKDKEKEDEDVPPFLKKKAEELETEINTLKTTLAELETSRAALAADLETVRAEAAAHVAKIAELQAIVDAAEAAKATEAKAARLVARKTELPESFIKAHEAREEATRTDVEAGWAEMDDEKWEFHKSQVLLFGFTAAGGKAGYVSRSKQEGVLLNQSAPQDDTRGKLRASLKNKR